MTEKQDSSFEFWEFLDFLAYTLAWDQPRIVSVYFFFSFETNIFEIGPLSPNASER